MADNPMYKVGKELQSVSPNVLFNKMSEIDQANQARQANSYNNASNFYNSYYTNPSNRAINNKNSAKANSY